MTVAPEFITEHDYIYENIFIFIQYINFKFMISEFTAVKVRRNIF